MDRVHCLDAGHTQMRLQTLNQNRHLLVAHLQLESLVYQEMTTLIYLSQWRPVSVPPGVDISGLHETLGKERRRILCGEGHVGIILCA